LASGSIDKIVYLWDVRSSAVVQQLPHNSGVVSVTFASDGKTLLSGGRDGSVVNWDLRTGQELNWLNDHHSPVYAIAYSSDGQQIVTGGGSHHAGQDSSLRLWNAGTAELIRTIPNDLNCINSARFLPDGKRVVIVGLVDQAHGAQVWDVQRGKKIADIGNFEGVNAGSMSVSSDGSYVLISDYQQRLQLWDLRSDTLAAQYFHDEQIRGAVLSLESHFALSASIDGNVRLWQLPESVWPELSPLEREITEYQRIIDEKSGDPTAQRQVAEAYYEIGKRLVPLERREEAEQAYLRAIELYEPIVTQNQQHSKTRRMEAELYFALSGARRGGAAIDTARKAIEIAEKVRADFPDDPWAANIVLRCVIKLIWILGDTEETRERLEHCLALVESTDKESTPGLMANYLELRYWKARFLTNDKEYDSAVSILKSVVETRKERNARSHPVGIAGREHLYNFTSQLVSTLIKAARAEEAADRQKDVVEILTTLVEDYPDIPYHKQHLQEESALLMELRQQVTRGQSD
jgi:WD40 repeat protein